MRLPRLPSEQTALPLSLCGRRWDARTNSLARCFAVTLQCKQGLPRTNPCLRTSQHQCNVYIQFIYPPPPTQSSCEQISLQQSVNTVRGEASARFLMYNLPHPVQTPYLAFSISCSPVTQSERSKHTKSHSHRASYHTSTQRRER